jgi:hypothetical protein
MELFGHIWTVNWPMLNWQGSLNISLLATTAAAVSKNCVLRERR